MKFHLIKWLKLRKQILNHNVNIIQSQAYNCDCRFCVKTDQDILPLTSSMSQNSDRSSQKRASICLSSDEENSQNPEKKLGLSVSPSASMATGSSSSLGWPPLSGARGGSQEEALTDVSMPPVQTFNPPGTSALKEVCDQMIQEFSGKNPLQPGDDASFASKAKKVRKFYPFTVFIVAGETYDKPLDKRQYTAFEEFIWQKRIKMTYEENNDLKIEWMSYHDSYGVVCCEDKPTGVWVKNAALTFKFEEKATKAYFPWEREESVVFGVFLKGPMFRQKHIKPNWALGQIFKANNLVGDWKSISWDSKRNPSGIYLEFEPVGEELIQKLEKMQFLNCLTCKPILNRRTRKGKSEEAYLAGLKTDPALKDVKISGSV